MQRENYNQERRTIQNIWTYEHDARKLNETKTHKCRLPHVLICSLRQDLVNVSRVDEKVVFGTLAGGRRSRERPALTWMTCSLYANGHVSSWELPPFLIVVVRRVPPPHAWPPIFSVAICAINKSCVDVNELNPYFVAAALVCTLRRRLSRWESRTHRACEEKNEAKKKKEPKRASELIGREASSNH